MDPNEVLEKVLEHNWLSIYDCCDSDEYESINEKEELLEGRGKDANFK